MTKEIPKVLKLAPSKVEAWVNDVLGRFFVLSGLSTDAHISSTLMAIMQRMDYTPKRELLAGNHRIDPDTAVEDIGLLKIIQKHISAELLEDLLAEIELAEVDGRATVLTMRDENGQLVEGKVFVSESGKLSYTEHEDKPLDVSEDRGKSWGSW